MSGVKTYPEIKKTVKKIITYNLISDYAVAYNIFRNKHICYNF